MSIATRNPVRFIGGNKFSGGPNTGEFAFTQGGQLNATVYSGGILSPGSGFLPTGAVQTADQVQLWSGAGRLNAIIPLGTPGFTLSGIACNFYDSAQVARSGKGPNESGYANIAQFGASQGASGAVFGTGFQVWGVPFNSGLCVSCVSGINGFNVTFSPEVVNPSNT